MMPTITVFEKKADHAERGKIIAQAKRLNIVTEDAFMPMFRFIEWMTPVFFEETVTVKIRDHQAINEP